MSDYLSIPQQAAREKIDSMNNIKTLSDVHKAERSKVSIFDSNVKTDADKQNAYEEYSQALLDGYYDENKDGTVTKEEFAKVEQKAAMLNAAEL